MSALTNTATTAHQEHVRPTAQSVRPFYWSVRRELWEHRSLYLAPSIVAVLLLAAVVVAALRLPESISAFDSFVPDKQRDVVTMPYAMIALALIGTAVVMTFFYCTDALFGERRDRSTLFWKSMPVSDWTAVLAKLAVPMLLIPAFIVLLVLATQLLVLLGNMTLWYAKGLSVSNLLRQLPLPDMPVGVVHFVFTLAVWYAPIYGWLLLVSAWAQRSPLAWALVPLIVVTALERLVFGSSRVLAWLQHRLTGSFDAAFVQTTGADPASSGLDMRGADGAGLVYQRADPVPDLLRFLSNADVWIGVAICAALIVATVWLRRRQDALSA